MSSRSSAAAQSVISLETARGADRDPAGSQGEPNLSDQYRILALMIDRMQRRIVDMLRLELGRIGALDVTAPQALLLLSIGEDEISVREFQQRTAMVGTSVSYAIKCLSEAGYIERCEGLRDRRTGRLKLTEKGLSLRHDLRDLGLAQVRAMKRLGHDADKIQATLDLLMDLERIQANVCHL